MRYTGGTWDPPAEPGRALGVTTGMWHARRQAKKDWSGEHSGREDHQAKRLEEPLQSLAPKSPG